VDLGGDQVTELNTTSGTYAWAHSNVFSAARLTATYDVKYTNSVNTGGLHYELADPLGTKRVQANISGVVEMTWASLPFGDALTPIAPTNPPSTSDDATEHHFTQKERDTESNNDYFFARYYNSAIGRFTTPDWSAKVVPVPYAKLDNPQSLNLYSYVLNNPLSRVDSNGHDVVLGNTTDKDRKATARRVTQNLSAEEKKMFKVGVDKATHRNELMLKPGAKLDGHHTEAFSRLVTEVSDHQHTATVKLQSNFTDQNGEVQSVAGPAAGGGVTRDLGGGNSLILLAPEGNLSEPLHPGTLPGLTGGRVDDPTSTIAGHELMGHGYELMTTGTSDEGTTRQFENRMRSEEGESPRSIQ
jgi:RHS repeat-associated protein